MLQYQPSFAFDDEPGVGPISRPQEPAARLDDGALLDAYSRAVIDVVEALGPAVVRLDVRPSEHMRQGGTGSGVIVAPDGLVIASELPSHVPVEALSALAATLGRELEVRGPRLRRGIATSA